MPFPSRQEVFILYYYGFEKQPVFPDLSTVSDLEQLELITLEYPCIHTIVADAVFMLAGFNSRAEAALTLMEDRDNIDCFAYAAGFDRSISISSLNVYVSHPANII